MFSVTRSLLLGGLLLAAGAAGAQSSAPAAAPVVVDRVRSQAMDGGKPATGTVHSRQTLQLMAGVAGRLDWVAEAGSLVEAGDVLARVDVTPLVLQREEQLARIRRAQTNRDYLAREFKRLQGLGDSKYVSDGELDELALRRDLAERDIDIARVQVRQLEDQLARAKLVAPFAGVVSEQWRYAGEEVSRGEAISRLISTRDIEFRAQLPLSWLPALKVGDVVRIRANGQETLAQIRSLIAAGRSSSQTFEARIDFPAGAGGHWAVGQLADVHLPDSLLARELLVPRDALVLRRDAVYVFRIQDGGKAERVNVQVGAGRGDWVAVEGPLTAGDSVAVRGAERLQSGQAVNVIRDLASERADRTAG